MKQQHKHTGVWRIHFKLSALEGSVHKPLYICLSSKDGSVCVFSYRPTQQDPGSAIWIFSRTRQSSLYTAYSLLDKLCWPRRRYGLL